MLEELRMVKIYVVNVVKLWFYFGYYYLVYIYVYEDICVKINMYVLFFDSKYCMIKFVVVLIFIISSSKMILKLKGKNYMFYKIINMY